MQKRVISKMWLNVTVLEQKKNRATIVEKYCCTMRKILSCTLLNEQKSVRRQLLSKSVTKN